MQQFEESYFTPYIAHAATPKRTAPLWMSEKTAPLSGSAHRGFRADSEIAKAIGMTADKVRVITPIRVADPEARASGTSRTGGAIVKDDRSSDSGCLDA